jgi:hypothetical protein
MGMDFGYRAESGVSLNRLASSKLNQQPFYPEGRINLGYMN